MTYLKIGATIFIVAVAIAATIAIAIDRRWRRKEIVSPFLCLFLTQVYFAAGIYASGLLSPSSRFVAGVIVPILLSSFFGTKPRVIAVLCLVIFLTGLGLGGF